MLALSWSVPESVPVSCETVLIPGKNAGTSSPLPSALPATIWGQRKDLRRFVVGLFGCQNRSFTCTEMHCSACFMAGWWLCAFWGLRGESRLYRFESVLKMLQRCIEGLLRGSRQVARDAIVIRMVAECFILANGLSLGIESYKRLFSWQTKSTRALLAVSCAPIGPLPVVHPGRKENLGTDSQ